MIATTFRTCEENDKPGHHRQVQIQSNGRAVHAGTFRLRQPCNPSKFIGKEASEMSACFCCDVESS